jgi:hypothetical protein
MIICNNKRYEALENAEIRPVVRYLTLVVKESNINTRIADLNTCAPNLDCRPLTHTKRSPSPFLLPCNPISVVMQATAALREFRASETYNFARLLPEIVL